MTDVKGGGQLTSKTFYDASPHFAFPFFSLSLTVKNKTFSFLFHSLHKAILSQIGEIMACITKPTLCSSSRICFPFHCVYLLRHVFFLIGRKCMDSRSEIQKLLYFSNASSRYISVENNFFRFWVDILKGSVFMRYTYTIVLIARVFCAYLISNRE